ncbi:hypothetical protein [Methylobacterium sp. J-092]|uniref:hypothetical protein n=1 Tax=Methylobacterium sp. J-092 TaxID=2836667 RepID=UPI001FB8B1D5|nr:hypothetical protein [Methylobacterium sp. J-092]MCJ2008087.1 hypothetical protein [Methylobacterium sp. J-092]
MRMHPLGLLCLAVVALSAGPAHAKRLRPDDLLVHGQGCWTRAFAPNASLEWCFRQGGIVDGGATKDGEGFEEKGVYRSFSEHVVILGFPGNGWPTENYVEDCRYRFEDDFQILVLDGCSSAGRWRRTAWQPLTP